MNNFDGPPVAVNDLAGRGALYVPGWDEEQRRRREHLFNHIENTPNVPVYRGLVRGYAIFTAPAGSRDRVRQVAANPGTHVDIGGDTFYNSPLHGLLKVRLDDLTWSRTTLEGFLATFGE